MSNYCPWQLVISNLGPRYRSHEISISIEEYQKSRIQIDFDNCKQMLTHFSMSAVYILHIHCVVIALPSVCSQIQSSIRRKQLSTVNVCIFYIGLRLNRAKQKTNTITMHVKLHIFDLFPSILFSFDVMISAFVSANCVARFLLYSLRHPCSISCGKNTRFRCTSSLIGHKLLDHKPLDCT